MEENTELYKKDLNDPNNHNGVIIHLELDIQECKVKWALGSITTNKASEGDGIPVELFQILKDDAVKVLHSICQQIGKTQQWPQDWKRSVFIPIPKKGNARECSNYCTIVLISYTSKVIFHAKIGTIKSRNSIDLREAEDIQKRWQENTEELYKKDLHDPDNHNGVITHLELDILECKVKWALGSITTNKASGGIPVELFQVLKDDAVKVLCSICQQIWKKVSFQSNPKERQCQRMLKLPHNWHSSHTLVK